MQTARAAAHGRVSVELDRPGRQVLATFDRGGILRLAGVLLDNAVKYTPEGGEVTVRVRERDGRAELEVSDTGMGISDNHVPFVFERFYRADPSRTTGGAGLGLSIAHQIAEAHGGTIGVTSKPGIGSTFTFSLPKKEPVPKKPGP